MDVYIYLARLNLDKQEIRNSHSFGHQSVVGFHDSLVEVGMLHESTIDEEIVASTLLTGRFWFANKSRHLTHGRLYLDRHKVLTVLFAKHIGNTLACATGTQIHHFYPIMMQGEVDAGVNEHNTLEGSEDVIKLGGVGLKELATGRDIEEEVIYLEVAANRA